MDNAQWQVAGYECVEPEAGTDLWKLALPDLAAGERRRLEDHVDICVACQLRLDVERKIGQGLAMGDLLLPSDQQAKTGWARRAKRLSAPRHLAPISGFALAASLVLAFVLPPNTRDHGLMSRSGTASVIRRPVEGEVVLGHPSKISWDAIPGTTKYRLSVLELGGDFTWHGETRDHYLAMPADIDLPASREFRILLTTVPADLVRPEGISASFSTADFKTFVRYRLSAAAKLSRLLFYWGLAGILGAGFMRVWQRN